MRAASGGLFASLAIGPQDRRALRMADGGFKALTSAISAALRGTSERMVKGCVQEPRRP